MESTRRKNDQAEPTILTGFKPTTGYPVSWDAGGWGRFLSRFASSTLLAASPCVNRLHVGGTSSVATETWTSSRCWADSPGLKANGSDSTREAPVPLLLHDLPVSARSSSCWETNSLFPERIWDGNDLNPGKCGAASQLHLCIVFLSFQTDKS